VLAAGVHRHPDREIDLVLRYFEALSGTKATTEEEARN
jgi:hypothetical protein